MNRRFLACHANELPLHHQNQSSDHGSIFTMCLQTFSLFWLRKTSVIDNMFQLNFRVFMCTFHLEITSCFRYEFPLSFPIFALFVLRYFPFPRRNLKLFYRIGRLVWPLSDNVVAYWLIGFRFDSWLCLGIFLKWRIILRYLRTECFSAFVLAMFLCCLLSRTLQSSDHRLGVVIQWVRVPFLYMIHRSFLIPWHRGVIYGN